MLLLLCLSLQSKWHNLKTYYMKSPHSKKNQLNQTPQDQNLQNELSKQLKMSKEEVVPPPYLWEKIEHVLNQKQERIKIGEEILVSTFKLPSKELN